MSNKKISTEKSYFKNYNSQLWFVQVDIINTCTQQKVTLITENISYIEISNSLESWVPNLILKYTDYNFALSPFLKQTRFIINDRTNRTVSNITGKYGRYITNYT